MQLGAHMHVTWHAHVTPHMLFLCIWTVITHKVYSRRFDHNDPVHRKCKSLRKVYAMMIEIQKKCHWEGFLESVDKRMVWMAHQYASGEPTDGGKACVPTLKVWQHDG